MIRKVEHCAIIVKDMDKSIEYYTTIFDFQLRIRGKNEKREMAFLKHKNQPDFEIELIKDRIELGSYSEKGIVNHLAFTVDDMEKAMIHFQEKGIVFLSDQPNVAIGGAKTIFFEGPNLELLQLVEPNT